MHQIYAIQHNKTRKIYIGCSKNVGKRYLEHISLLRRGTHSSAEMQSDFNNYGADFSLFVLQKVPNGSVQVVSDEFDGAVLTKRVIAELKWMREYNTVVDGYNVQDIKARRILGIEKGKEKIPFCDGLPKKN